MMANFACPSTLELLDFRDGNGSASVRAHVRQCARCQVALNELKDLQLDEVQPRGEPNDSKSASREAQHPPENLATGQVWTAIASENAEEREIVVVIGRPGGRQDDLVIVAPTATALEEAAESDLIVTSSPLGYPHLVCVWAQGVLERGQLVDYLGRLDRGTRVDLVDLYRWLTGAAEEPETSVPTGPKLAGEEDSRLIFRSLVNDRLRALWRRVDESLETSAEEAAVFVHPTLRQAIHERFESGAWDRSTLLEASRVEGSQLDAIMKDRLDLTHETDVSAVAAIVAALEIDDPTPLVKASLELSLGGEPWAPEQGARLAARSFSDVSGAKRTHDLYLGRLKVDESPEARQRAIERYLKRFAQELDAIR
jgi:hypothetical protein